MLLKISRGALAGALAVLTGGVAMAGTEQIEYTPLPTQTTHPASATGIYVGTGTLGSAGVLVIDGGSTITILDNSDHWSHIKVGSGEGRTGSLVVTGSGSAILKDSGVTVVDLVVGNGSGADPTGHGIVNVTKGASIATDTARIGDEAMTTGTVNIIGAGSSWNMLGLFADGSVTESPYMYVGKYGHGTLNLIDGGLLLMDPQGTGAAYGPSLSIARYMSSSGAVNVTGTDSKLKIAGDGANLFVGGFGHASLRVADGGLVQLGLDGATPEFPWGAAMMIARYTSEH